MKWSGFKIFFLALFCFAALGLSANGNSFFGLDSCKFCKKTINAVQIPIWKSKIHFTPVFAWNNSDKTQLGIAFYSKPKLKNVDFVFVPMFALGSKNLTGLANFSYTFPLRKIKSFELGFKSRRFSYLVFPEDLAYNKVEPFFEIELNKAKKEKLQKHQQTIGFRSSLIFLEYLSKGRQTQFYYVNELNYKYDFKQEKNNIWFQFTAKQSTSFASVSGEINLDINFPTRRKNAFRIRAFAGGFLFSNFNGDAPIAKFLLSGSTNTFLPQYQKDFQFDQFYFDRNAQDPFFSRQVAILDGGFRSITSAGNSYKYLFALNLSSDIPIPIPIEPWANFALIDEGTKPGFAAEFGASIVLFDRFIQFHFPFVTTNNIKNNQSVLGITNFGQRISFSMDLMKLGKK
ncbi:MAG: hypothetical protein ACPG4Y_05695 [Chitinophagales bacterium]